jgi:poly-gamma-glutamate synthesis protein (capsule biosynthesis protein)
VRLAVALAVVPLAAGLAGAAPARSEAPPPSRPSLPRVDSELPDWLAPGGRLVVSGWTGASMHVRLRVGRGIVVGTTSGRLGRFRLEARAPRRAGRYGVSVEVEGRRRPVGPLRVRSLVLAAVGDVTFGDRVGTAIEAGGPRLPWRHVAGRLRSADVATANLEGAVSTRGAPVADKEYHFRGPPAALGAAAGFAGLDVVSLANNHSLDFGRDAFLDTLRHAKRFGLATVGGGADLAEARRAVVLEQGGLRIAFLGYSDVRPLGFDAGPGLAGTAPARPELIDADVRAARRRADVVVVWFHWGEELATEPAWRQQQLAAAALNAGSTLVLGAHPHVLQPLTDVPSRRLVAWSLGNFVFPAASPGTTRTGILVVRLARRGVESYRLEPATIHGVQPRPGRT